MPFLQRLPTAALVVGYLLVTLLVLPVDIGTALYAALVTVACVVGGWEAVSLLARTGQAHHPALAIGGCAAAALAVWTPIYLDFLPGRALLRDGPLLVLVVVFAASFGRSIWRSEISAGWPKAMHTAGVVLYVGVLGSFWIKLRTEHTSAHVIACLFWVWMADTFALIGGMAFGKRPLTPQVSPKKTIEGFVASVVGTGALSAIVALVHPDFPVKWPEALFLGLVIPVIAHLGDLAESLAKRAANVKDSSNLIPGHGGVLDKLDSPLFVGPFCYYWWALT